MAEAIHGAIERMEVLVAEAGTGTGKTFAYLVPALLAGGKVILSTGTKTLQDQLFDRDLPAVREALGPGGTLQGQRAATSASGRLGEWCELGSLTGTSARDERGLGSSARAAGSESRRVWVKVEELPERRN